MRLGHGRDKESFTSLWERGQWRGSGGELPPGHSSDRPSQEHKALLATAVTQQPPWRLGSSPWAHLEEATPRAPKGPEAIIGNVCQNTSVGITRHLGTRISASPAGAQKQGSADAVAPEPTHHTCPPPPLPTQISQKGHTLDKAEGRLSGVLGRVEMGHLQECFPWAAALAVCWGFRRSREFTGLLQQR